MRRSNVARATMTDGDTGAGAGVALAAAAAVFAWPRADFAGELVADGQALELERIAGVGAAATRIRIGSDLSRIVEVGGLTIAASIDLSVLAGIDRTRD